MPFSVCGKESKHPKKRMEQNIQDVAQKVQHDKNSYTFAAHFAQHLDQKNPTTVPWNNETRDFFKVNPIGLMKTWSKSSCTLCMKEKI